METLDIIIDQVKTKRPIAAACVDGDGVNRIHAAYGCNSRLIHA